MKLLLVEDSALMRRVLREGFAQETDIEILFARDGEDAIEKLERFQPDVITLDINMPRMDGLTCLAHIMETRPCPVIMLSSLTEKGAIATFEALELGATDFVAKPDGTVSTDISGIIDELLAKIRTAYRKSTKTPKSGGISLRQPANLNKPTVPVAVDPRVLKMRPKIDLVVIGSSTGGPGIVQSILECMPTGLPAPIVIAQHMPPKFTSTFASRLDATCKVDVIEVTEAMPLVAGCVYLASGGRDLVFSRKFNRLMAQPVKSDPRYTWHPSISRMVESALGVLDPKRLVGIMLTGMGDDGSSEMARIHQSGGVTIAESEASAAVFGMPGKLIEKAGATCVLDAADIPDQLLRWFGSAAVLRKTKC